MVQVTRGCETPSELEKRRSLFYIKLSECNIELEKRDFYDQNNIDNLKYNIESDDIVTKYAKEWNIPKYDIERSLVVLSNVNKMRKGPTDKGFDRSSFMFVTGTYRTKRLAWINELKSENQVPLASMIDFVINHFWMKLNKGFGEGLKPRTLDMVIQARTLLAGILNDKVSKEYQRQKESYEKGDITKEQFIIFNNELKGRLLSPDEIDVERFEDELNELNKWDFDDIQAKYDFEKAQHESVVEENRILNLTVQEIKEQNIYETKKKEALEKEVERKTGIISSKDKDIEEKNKRIKELEELLTVKQIKEQQRIEKKENVKRIMVKLFSRTLICIIIFLTVAGFAYCVLGELFGWPYTSAVTNATAFLGLFGLISSVIKYLSQKGKKG